MWLRNNIIKPYQQLFSHKLPSTNYINHLFTSTDVYILWRRPLTPVELIYGGARDCSGLVGLLSSSLTVYCCFCLRNTVFYFKTMNCTSASLSGSNTSTMTEVSLANRVLSGYRSFMYLWSPSETSFAKVEDVPNYVGNVSIYLVIICSAIIKLILSEVMWLYYSKKFLRKTKPYGSMA